MFTVQFAEEEFNIVGPDGEESEAVQYGDIATLKIGAALYYCEVKDPENETPRVLRVDQVTAMPTEMEEVEFTDEDESGGPVLVGTEDEEEEEEEEEEEAPGVEIH